MERLYLSMKQDLDEVEDLWKQLILTSPSVQQLWSNAIQQMIGASERASKGASERASEEATGRANGPYLTYIPYFIGADMNVLNIWM